MAKISARSNRPLFKCGSRSFRGPTQNVRLPGGFCKWQLVYEPLPRRHDFASSRRPPRRTLESRRCQDFFADARPPDARVRCGPATRNGEQEGTCVMGFESSRVRRIRETEVTSQQANESRNKAEAARALKVKEVKQYRQLCRLRNNTSYQSEEKTRTCPTSSTRSRLALSRTWSIRWWPPEKVLLNGGHLT